MKNKIILTIISICIIYSSLCFTSCRFKSHEKNDVPMTTVSETEAVESTAKDVPIQTLVPETETTTPQSSNNDESEYILPNSNSKKLTESDVKGLSKYEVTLAINEIYARHGRKFNSKNIKDYFNSKSWYKGNTEPDDFDISVLNSTEKYNINFLIEFREAFPSESDPEPDPEPNPEPDPDPEPEPDPATDSDAVLCPYCNGIGHCAYCVFGDCLSCNGRKETNCTYCYNAGKCGSCGGCGYYYDGVGITFGKRQCKSCRGSGLCSSCGGTGKIICSMCRGSGSCDECHGDYFCKYCGGIGIIY